MKRNPSLTVLLAAALLATGATAACAGDSDHHGHDHDHDHSAHAEKAKAAPAEAAKAAVPAEKLTGAAAVVAAQLPTYPLTVCPVSGEELGSMGDPVNHVHEGRLVRFCCSMCEPKFTADPATYLAKVDAAVVEAQLADYPLDACPVSGKKLGSMGDPYDHVHGTRLVRFCCGGCLDTFAADPAKFLAKIDAAMVPETAEAE